MTLYNTGALFFFKQRMLPAMASFLKLFHVLFIFIWIGSLLTLTRFFIYYAQEPPPIQMKLSRIFRRTYFFIDLPSMVLAVASGVLLLFLKKINYTAGWFHMKMTFAFLLIIGDAFCGRTTVKLCRAPMQRKVLKFYILHGAVALFLIGALASIYILKQGAASNS